MIVRSLPTIIALLFASTLTASEGGMIGGGNPPAKMDVEREQPGTGVLCMWALVNAAAEVGRRCRGGQNPTFQAELDHSVSRFDEFVQHNSDATPEQLAQFKNEQGMSGATEATLCRGDPVILYERMAAAGSETLRSEVDRVLARPGPPTWGDCL
jgi:hypothetical protein